MKNYISKKLLKNKTNILKYNIKKPSKLSRVFLDLNITIMNENNLLDFLLKNLFLHQQGEK